MVRLLLLTFVLAPSSALALSDGGPPNGACTEDSTLGEWLYCGVHADCPAGQVCLASGVCGCECPRGEACNDWGCECCPTRELDEGCRLESVPGACPRVVCPEDGGCSAAGGGSFPWALVGFLTTWALVRRRGLSLRV